MLAKINLAEKGLSVTVDLEVLWPSPERKRWRITTKGIEANKSCKKSSLLPVPVAPELLVQIGAVAVVVSKRCFTLYPVYDVTLHSFRNKQKKVVKDKKTSLNYPKENYIILRS